MRIWLGGKEGCSRRGGTASTKALRKDLGGEGAVVRDLFPRPEGTASSGLSRCFPMQEGKKANEQ